MDNINLVFDLPGRLAIDTVSEGSSVNIDGDISELSNYDGVIPIKAGFKPQDSDACVFFKSSHIEGASFGSEQELS